MINQFSRTELLFGKSLDRLKTAHIAVFGIGGVGGFTVEALVRSGVGKIDLIDADKICLTNLNRLIFATRKNVGKYKTEIAKERIKEINPNCEVNIYNCFYSPKNSYEINMSKYNYVIDAIDSVESKLEIIKNAKNQGVPVISCMGTGNKLDPTAFVVTDIYQTKICPLAKIIRKLCKQNNINSLKVVYSKEKTMSIKSSNENLSNSINNTKQVQGSNSFVSSVAGLIIAGEVIKDITGVYGLGIDNS